MSKVVSLSFEYDHDYELLAITSALEEYRLAFFLNKYLKLNLKKDKNNLDFEDSSRSFSMYSFCCETTSISWYLIKNKAIFTTSLNQQSNLFDEESQLLYLINEKRNVDYFIKICDCTDPIKPKLEALKNIPGIIAIQNLNPQTLKSKDYLIF